MKILISIATLLVVTIGNAQNEKNKRTAYHLEIAANETQQYEYDVPESPFFVKDKVLQIYCNENVFVECEIAGDSISSMKVVEKNVHPEKTIAIEFTQNAKDRTSIRTELRVKNPFKKTLTHKAGMFTPKSEKWRETSIIPIGPEMQNLEMWPHAIITLVLHDWELK